MRNVESMGNVSTVKWISFVNVRFYPMANFVKAVRDFDLANR